MSLHLPLLLALMLAPQGDSDLGDPVKYDAMEFSFRPPTGWPMRTGIPPTIAKFQAPEKGPENGQIAVIVLEAQQPRPLAALVEDIKPHMAKEFASHKIVEDREVKSGGLSARLLVVEGTSTEGREVTLVRTFVQRGLLDLYLLEGSCARKDGARIVALTEKMVGACQYGTVPTKEEAEGLARFGDALRSLGRPPGPGEIYHIVTYGDRRLGTQRLRVGEGKVEGRPGTVFESELVLKDEDGGRKTLRSRGGISVDGAVQRVDHELEVEDKAKTRQTFKESAILTGTQVSFSREVGGQKSDTRATVPAGTLLLDIADFARGLLALKGKATYTMRVLSPFRDEPRIESLEVAAPDKLKAHDGEREMVAVFSKQMRTKNIQYFFEKDGSLYRVASGKSPLKIQRCTKEESERP